MASKVAKPVTVDFSDVEGGRRNCPDDNYNLEVVSIEEKESGEGNPYWLWKWKVVDGEYKGVTIYDNTSLLPQALWRIRGLLECLGVEIKGKMKLDPTKYIKRRLQAAIVNETYQGKTRPKIGEFLGPVVGVTSSEPSMFRVGEEVLVNDGDSAFRAVVKSISGKKIVVTVEVDDGSEEWEVSDGDLEKVGNTAQPEPKSSQPALIDDDDIPF